MSRSPAADLAPLIKLLQAGVPPDRAANELSRVLAIWTVELKGDGEQLQERLSGLAEQMTTGIEEASDKGKPTLRRILETHEAVLDGVRRAQDAGEFGGGTDGWHARLQEFDVGGQVGSRGAGHAWEGG